MNSGVISRNEVARERNQTEDRWKEGHHKRVPELKRPLAAVKR